MKSHKKLPKAWLGLTVGLVLATSQVVASTGRASAAACSAPATNYGSVTTSINVPAAATYRLWSRIMAPDTTNNTYLLEVDGNTCYNVGGTSIPASSWTWVDYKDGSTSSKVQQSLSQGSHTLKLIGNKPGVKLDRVVAVSDTACVPSGNGDNCNAPSDSTAPIVTLTAPVEGATVSGNVNLTATASDNKAVTKVEFYDNSSLLATDTTSPYSATWDSTKTQNGSHLITARAYDAANNVSSDANTVTARNGDTQAPTAPPNVKATATAYNSVTVTWSASSDNSGIAGYSIIRDGVPLTSLGNVTTFTDNGLSANATYAYQVVAIDAAGNKSVPSSKVSVKTPTVPDSQAPNKPTGLTATAASDTQINLAWQPATDNIGVVSYSIYRSIGSNTPVVIGQSATTSFGDSNLTASTTYAYYVVAKDASANASPASDTVTATTQNKPAPDTVSRITGVVTRQGSSKVIPYATIVLSTEGKRHTYQADRFGRYAIYNLKTGTYNLTFKARGYYSKTVAVDLTTTPLTQNMALKKR